MTEFPQPRILRPTFELHAHERDNKNVVYPAIDFLMRELAHFDTEQSIQNLGAEEHIRYSFEAFLNKCGYKSALQDFQTLITENENEYRSNGSIAWYHQFGPILTFLSLVRDGKISLDALQYNGGLETVIRTHIHHDRVEDIAISLQRFGKDLWASGAAHLEDQQDAYQIAAKKDIAVYQNVMLMSKKRVAFNIDGNVICDDDGKPQKIKIFENDREYMHNMLSHHHAVPEVWVLKLKDGIDNQASLYAPKFSPERRLEKCMDLVDMFTSPDGFSDIAMEKWPLFARAIDTCDSLLGALVYFNLGDLQHVEGLEIPETGLYFRDGNIDIRRVGAYLDDIVSINVPRAFHPIHRWLDTERNKALNHEDPVIRDRTKAYLLDHVYPLLEPYRDHFPRIFKASDGAHGVLTL